MLTAQNGEEALELTKRVHPDLILLDVMLPGIDGLEFCRRLKSDSATQGIPVIFMTAQTDIRDKLAAFEAGAVDYLTKPLQIEEVNARVEPRLELSIMRKRVAAQNAELATHRDNLEHLVSERTAELHESNQQLRAEIEEHRSATEELTAREREFRTVTELLPDNLARYDTQGRIVYFNPMLEDTLGMSTAEAYGKTPRQAVPGPVYVEYQRHLMETLASGQPSEFELCLPDTGAGVRYHHILIVAERNTDGAVVGALTIGRDVTELRHNERELRLLNLAVNASSEAAFLMDESGRFVYVNEQACSSLGYSREELLTMSPLDIDPDITPEQFREVLDSIFANGPTRPPLESHHRARNGRLFPIEIAASPITLEGEHYCLAMVRDISERKRTEQALAESEQEFRTLAENAPDSIARHDRECRFLFVNPRFEATRGIAAREILGKTPVEDFPDNPDVAAYQARMANVLETGEPAEFEAVLPDEGKGVRFQQIRLIAERDEQNNILGVLAIGRDITERKLAETELIRHREHLEELVKERTSAFQQSEARLRALIDNLPFEFWAMDAELRYTMQNSTSIKNYGSVVGMGVHDLGLSTDLVDHWLEIDRRVLAGEIIRYEYEKEESEGKRRVYESLLAPVEVADSVIGIVGVGIDITERKHYEEELRRTADFQQTLLKGIKDVGMQVMVVENGRAIYVANREYAAEYGYTAERLAEHPPFIDVIHPDDRARVAEYYRRRVAGEPAPTTYECGVITPDGRRRENEAAVSVIPGTDPVRVIAIMRDITERKQTERELKEALEFTRGIINAIPDILFEVDRDGRYLNIWTRNPELLAAHHEQLLGNTFGDVLAPEAAATAMEALREAEADQFSFGKVIRIDLPNGPRWFELSVSRMDGETSSDIRFIMLSREVTERILAEEEIRTWNAELEQRVQMRTAQLESANRDLSESEQRYRMVFENSPVSIWEEDMSAVRAFFDELSEGGVIDLEAYFKAYPEAVQACADRVRIIDVNQAALALHKAQSKEALFVRLADTFTPESFEAFRRELVGLWNNEKVMRIDAMVRTLAGEPRYVTVHFAVCPGYEKSLEKVLVSLVDVTERKEAERLLHAQQQALQAAVDNSPDAIIRYDRNLRRIYINRTMQRIFGVPVAKVLGTKPSEFSILDMPEAHNRLIRTTLETGEEQQAELSYKGVNGTRWMDLRFAPEFNADGQVASVLAVGHDITIRRAMERENALLRAMADNAVDPLILAHTLDAEAGLPLQYFNPSLARHLGYSTEQMRGLTISDFTDYSMKEMASRMETLRRKKSLRFETEHIRKNGERVPVEVILSYLMHEGEELAAGYCMDISQRKEAERRLQESHAQLQEFASRLETAREQERKHIARELHDELGQYLTALRLLISAVDIEIGRQDSMLEKKFTQMLELLDNTKQVLRNLSQKLRPEVLDMGIDSALEWLVSEFESHSGIPCKLVLDKQEVFMADTCATVVFRVVQESLTNVARHANAHTVSVILSQQNEQSVLEIRDDGDGFDQAQIKSGSFGLLGMRERVLAIGGQLHIDTAPGEGTRIIASIPLNIERDNDDKD